MLLFWTSVLAGAFAIKEIYIHIYKSLYPSLFFLHDTFCTIWYFFYELWFDLKFTTSSWECIILSIPSVCLSFHIMYRAFSKLVGGITSYLWSWKRLSSDECHITSDGKIGMHFVFFNMMKDLITNGFI